MKTTAKEKSKKFALRIIRLYKYLTQEQKEFVLSKQILRSGTSIGANLAESACAISPKDFLSKVYISLKEAEETLYWLDLLKDSDYITLKMYESLAKDCKDILRILSKTTLTMSKKLNICTLHSAL